MAIEAGALRQLSAPEPIPIAVGPKVELLRSRVEIGELLIDRVDLATATERIRNFVASGHPHQVVTVNLDFLTIAARDPFFRDTINQAKLSVADGMPLVWLSRLRRDPLPERVAGVELVGECCAIAAETARSVFLLGAGPGVAHRAAERLRQDFPGLQVVAYSPPMGPLRRADNDRIVRMIRRARPAFLFVALGAPRQDLWIRDHLDKLQVPVAMGVGCVFDLLAGDTRRAPYWMRSTGLEWAYRLTREPGRLWRRYLVQDVPMLARLVVGVLRQTRPAMAAVEA